MWNSFLDRGLELAEKAKRAAAELDQQLNESVGVPASASDSDPIVDGNIWEDDDDENEVGLEPLDEADGWNEDDIDTTSMVEDTGDEEEKEEEFKTDPQPVVCENGDVSQEIPVNGGSDIDEVPHQNGATEEDSEMAKETVSPKIFPSEESNRDYLPREEVVNGDGAKETTEEAIAEEPIQPATRERSVSEEKTTFITNETELAQVLTESLDDARESTKAKEQADVSGAKASDEHAIVSEAKARETATFPTPASAADQTDTADVGSVGSSTPSPGPAANNAAQIDTKNAGPSPSPSTSPPANAAKIVRQLQAQLAAAKQQRDQDRSKFTQRLSAAQQQAKQATSTADALRQEGERLAKSQAVMEAAVRNAKGELRGTQQELEQTKTVCEEQKEAIKSLESRVAVLSSDLGTASSTASTATQLQTELLLSNEECERKQTTILNLEQQNKELKILIRDVTQQLDSTQQESASETATVQKQLRQQHSTAITELQQQAEAAAREAAQREDDLREQLDSVRKQWQDAVRRADSLAVDYAAQSTPLLLQQQLESTNQQYRARAAAAAELELELRGELEKSVTMVESLSSECEQHRTSTLTLEATIERQVQEITEIQQNCKEQDDVTQRMETELLALREDVGRLRTELVKAERKAETCGLKVRGEMSQTLLDSETRHATQLRAIEAELRSERTHRSELEEELEAAKQQKSAAVSMISMPLSTNNTHKPEPKLRRSEGQAAILAGALGGFGDDDDDHSRHDDQELDVAGAGAVNGGSSYAALEELTAKWKSAKAELETLRKRLATSETARQELLDTLAEARYAREQLPSLEAKVSELSSENQELSLEVQGLREDIVDVRELYRSQLDSLIVAQTESHKGPPEESEDAPVPNEYNLS